MEPPLFEGEPEHCSLCGEAGHTHDDHWLFQHEPVKALVAQLAERDEAIRQAAELFDDMMGSDDMPEVQAWLALPIIKAARGQ